LKYIAASFLSYQQTAYPRPHRLTDSPTPSDSR
jgi:hypothetical protein